MADDHKDETAIPDPAELANYMANISEKSQEIVKSFRPSGHSKFGSNRPAQCGECVFRADTANAEQPAKMIEAQISLWQDY